MIRKVDAILALRPGAQFRLVDDELTWQDSELTEPTSEEIQTKYDELVAAEPLKLLRAERNAKLAETDWTQSRDVTLTNDAAWATYRQALRDITDTYSDLDSVVWPTKPE
jgi:hypothetical protein